jgi:outer membrane protein assembly factor BamB
MNQNTAIILPLVLVAQSFTSPAMTPLQVGRGAATTQGQASPGQPDVAMVEGNPQRSRAFGARALDRIPEQLLWKSEKLFTLRDLEAIRTENGPLTFWVDIPTDQSFSVPIISNGIAFFVFSTRENSYLYAIDTATGKSVVTLKFADNALSPPAARGHTVFVGAGSCRMHAYDLDARVEIWNHEEKKCSFAYFSPIIDEDVVYVAGQGLGMFAFRARTGEVLWTFRSKQWLYGPAISGNDLILTTGDGLMVALDKHTGVKKWETRIDGEASAPSILDDQIFLVRPSREIRAYALTNGALKWKSKIHGGAMTHLVLFKHMALYGAFEDSVVAIDADSGLEKWTFKTQMPCSSPLVAGDTLFAVCRDRKLYAIDPLTGQEKWRRDNKKATPPIPTFADGIMYALGSDGLMYAMK